MKKTKKVQLLATLFGATAVVAGLALLNAPVQASAAETTAAFAMKKGASVRAVEGEAGIRWITNVNKAWYNSVVEGLEEGQTIADYSFGTFVTSVDNVTTEEGEIDVTKLTSTTNEVKDLACDKEKTPDFTKEETTFTYYSSITYDAEDLEGVELAAYATELIARSYMKYTLVGSDTEYYVYADSNDNQRCMRAVALAAYKDETEEKLEPDEKTVVKDYFGNEEATVNTVADEETYFETAEDAIDTTKEYNVAYYGAKKVGTVEADGSLTLNDDFAYNEDVVLNLFNASGNYAQTETCKYVTAALDKSNFATYITTTGTISGYYVLKDDIDLSETGRTYYGVSNTFTGTLDGNGYKISGIADDSTARKKSYGGLFQHFNGTLRNVSIVGEFNYLASGLIAFDCTSKLSIENVYVDANLNTSSDPKLYLGYMSGAIMRQCVIEGANITMKNVVIVRRDTFSDRGAFFGFMGSKVRITMENCYYIGQNGVTPLGTRTDSLYLHMDNGGDVKVFGEKSTSGNVTTYANGLKGYTATTVEDAKAAFAAALTDTENPISLSDAAKELLAKANA